MNPIYLGDWESVEFLVTVRVFRCPQTTALSQAFLSYVIPVGWVDVVDVRELIQFSDARHC